nr:MAG TPA: Cro/C1-type HTH DNA-binding domain protein [Caudoviricetes sp.]
MIKFKIDILASLKEAGYNQTILQKGGLLPKSTIQTLKDGGNITLESLNKVCILTGLQPGDLLEYVSIPEETKKLFKKD